MFAVIKVVEMLLSPLDLALLALIIAAVLAWRGRHQSARRVLSTVTAFLLLLAVLPWSDWLVRPLENRFPEQRELPSRIDGIIVLGGSIDPVHSDERGRPVVAYAPERLMSMVELSRRTPEARAVFTGGSGSVTRQDVKDAHYARQLLEALGVPEGRVIYEDQSRNTRENAEFSKALAAPKDGETWLLVTSALHMPRSVGTFRAAGWPVTAYPVDYLSRPQPSGWGFNLARNSTLIRTALHEWIGLAYYRLRGWSDSWYPAP